MPARMRMPLLAVAGVPGSGAGSAGSAISWDLSPSPESAGTDTGEAAWRAASLLPGPAAVGAPRSPAGAWPSQEKVSTHFACASLLPRMLVPKARKPAMAMMPTSPTTRRYSTS